MEQLRILGAQLLTIWSQLGVNQKLTVGASGLLVAATLAVVVFFTSRTDFVLLYGGLDPKDAGDVVAVLEEQSIEYEAGAGGTSIKVPRDKVHSLRMTLARQGLPKSSGDGKGYELFDEKSTISMSDFVQQVNKKRAIEGELGRSIAMISGVDSARVMVVMPETRLIIDDNKKPTASVMVNLKQEGMIDTQAVNSIRFLVANSVPGLQHNHVSVVDNFGNTLSANEEGGSFGAMANNRLTARRNLELYLAGKVENILTGVLGPDQVRVTVSAELDHDQITHTSDIYDPTGSVTNNVMEKIEITGTTKPSPGGIVGTPINTNTSTNATSNALANNEQSKTESTVSFDNSHSTTNVVKAAGEIRRLTASVLVNEGTAPRDQAGMVQLTNIVKNAIGMHAQGGAVRQDDIVVAEMKFNRAYIQAAQAQMSSAATKDMIGDVLKNLFYVLLGAGALFAFVKLVKRSGDDVIQTGVPVGQLLGEGGGAMLAAPGGGAFSAPAGMSPGGGAAAGGGDAGGGGASQPITIEGSAGAVEINTDNMTLEDIEKTIAEAREGKIKLAPAAISQLMGARDEERERLKLLAATEDDVEVIEQEKQKLIMDFGLKDNQPERVNIEVLRDMITESPETMAVAARRWLKGETED
ncbi:MAG: flagellar basal-body MS-ring/collar protein FliF [Verrucomicrobiota bacterium]|nr:flagellar basal-body MS-ring/collar protein FliF [Verrucomicrobiota bacterium]